MTSEAFLLQNIFMLDFPVVRNLTAKMADARDVGSVPGSGRSLEKEMEIHSCLLTWENAWTEEAGELQPMGSQRVEHDWADTHTLVLYNLCTLMYQTWCHLKRVGISSYDWTSDLSKAQHLLSRPRPPVKRTERRINLHWCHGTFTVTYRRRDSDLVMKNPCRKLALSSKIVSCEGKMSSFSAQF